MNEPLQRGQRHQLARACRPPAHALVNPPVCSLWGHLDGVSNFSQLLNQPNAHTSQMQTSFKAPA